MKTAYLDTCQAEILRQWWRAIQGHTADGETAETAGEQGLFGIINRGDRARLKHCADINAVLDTSAYHRLAHHLMAQEEQKKQPRFSEDPTAYALVAGVLAHVHTDANNGTCFAALLGQPRASREGRRPAMSELRFQRLQACRSESDFYSQTIRALALLDGKADIVTLADDLLAWVWECRDGHAQDPGKRVKTRWASAYFSNALGRTRSGPGSDTDTDTA